MLPTWHQTLVIGNGFDLQCGLQSRFSDFYVSRYQQLYDAAADGKDGTPFGIRLKQMGLTVWDIILASQPPDLWCNVESAIAEKVANIKYYINIFVHINKI